MYNIIYVFVLYTKCNANVNIYLVVSSFVLYCFLCVTFRIAYASFWVIPIHRLWQVQKVFMSFYSYWNFEILRIVLPNVCLNVSTLQALAMDYLVALYPYVLILFSYFTIELYDRKCPCVVAMWNHLTMCYLSVEVSGSFVHQSSILCHIFLRIICQDNLCKC